MKIEYPWPTLSIACALWVALLCNLQAAPEYFPLEKGSFWIYRGETKFLVKNPATGKNEPKAEVLTWKMAVVDTVTRDLLFAALIKGAPFDLSWYEPGKAGGLPDCPGWDGRLLSLRRCLNVISATPSSSGQRQSGAIIPDRRAAPSSTNTRCIVRGSFPRMQREPSRLL
jgi:hypothetical protein